MSCLFSPLGANRDLTDFSGKKPLDYRKPKTSVSASTYSSEYSSIFDPNPYLVEDREHLGRESTGFLFALTYPRRKGHGPSATSTMGHAGGREMHERFMAEMRIDDERQVKKKRSASQRMVKTSRSSLLSLTHPVEDPLSQASSDKISESGSNLSRNNRTQQSFLRKKLGSMRKKTHKTSRSSYIWLNLEGVAVQFVVYSFCSLSLLFILYSIVLNFPFFFIFIILHPPPTMLCTCVEIQAMRKALHDASTWRQVVVFIAHVCWF